MKKPKEPPVTKDEIAQASKDFKERIIDLVREFAGDSQIFTKSLNPPQIAYILAYVASSVIHGAIVDGLDEVELQKTQHISLGILIDAIYDGRLEDERVRFDVLQTCKELYDEP